jgi:hypothetical protein
MERKCLLCDKAPTYVFGNDAFACAYHAERVKAIHAGQKSIDQARAAARSVKAKLFTEPQL